MSQIKVGFVGYGNSAKTYHLPYLLPVKELEVYAFLQRSAAPSAEDAKPGSHCTVDFPKARHYRSANDFFADPAIEVVIVTTHTDTHAKFARLALEAGKHVVVEKPFTSTSEEADALIALATDKKLLLSPYQNRRWDGEFRTLQHLNQKDALGTITEAEIYYDIDNPPWIHLLSAKDYTPGAGMLFGLGSHTLDQALVLSGRPKSVTAFLKVLRGIDNDIQERQTLSGMTYEDPKFGVNPEDEYGILTTYGQFDNSQIYDEASRKYAGRYPTLNGYNQGYYEMVANSVRRGKPLEVDAKTSRDGIRLMELARESHNKGATIQWS
ncbi:hypothetical protein PRZ48_012680 [Zasmidium cellare]|uniref:Oxidoreductase n=1 Tax=Zasmidium cellare TaxID=395010 RepID=A0ABR0E5I7_ZASCE|nr:hypothetical protein PRZ48_012680 [Zasmidium cellare]